MGLSLLRSCASLIHVSLQMFPIHLARTVSQASAYTLVSLHQPIPVQSLRRGHRPDLTLPSLAPRHRVNPQCLGSYHWSRSLPGFPHVSFLHRGGTKPVLLKGRSLYKVCRKTDRRHFRVAATTNKCLLVVPSHWSPFH